MRWSLTEFVTWRKAVGLTQEAAAPIMGVSKQALAKVETGRLPWSKKWPKRFKEAYSTPRPPKPTGRGAHTAAKLAADLKNPPADLAAGLTWGEMGLSRPDSDPAGV